MENIDLGMALSVLHLLAAFIIKTKRDTFYHILKIGVNGALLMVGLASLVI